MKEEEEEEEVEEEEEKGEKEEEVGVGQSPVLAPARSPIPIDANDLVYKCMLPINNKGWTS